MEETNEFKNKIIYEVRQISSIWIPEIKDLTKDELQAIIHYLWNYTAIYTINCKNEKILEQLYEKVENFKNLIRNNKEVRKKLGEFRKKNILDFREAFKEIWFDFEIKLN